jgi:hypothetical protein
LRFYLKVDPNTEPLRNSVLISQVWQGSSVAVGSRPALGPAFAISITDSTHAPDSVDVDFRYRNEVSRANPPRFFASYTAKKGTWHSFQVAMTPRYPGHPDGPGEILVWIDQPIDAEPARTSALNFAASDEKQSRFYWGYPPDATTSLGNSFDVRVGIYRPEPLVHVRFWMDGVKLAGSVAELLGP